MVQAGQVIFIVLPALPSAPNDIKIVIKERVKISLIQK